MSGHVAGRRSLHDENLRISLARVCEALAFMAELRAVV